MSYPNARPGVRANRHALGILFSLLLLLGIPATSCLALPLFPFRLPAEETPHPSVVRIVAVEGDGASSLGSGTLVGAGGDHGLVVTNWHVVKDAQEGVFAVFPNGFRSPASVVKLDKDWDLAAVVVWRPEAQPVPISREPARPGDALTIAGYGSGRYRSAAGRCTQYVAPGKGFPFEMVELSAQARRGDSGGPIFNQRGELAGVLFGAGWGTTSGSYSGRVLEFLKDVWPDYSAPNARPADPTRPREGQTHIATARLQEPVGNQEPVGDNARVPPRERRGHFGPPAAVPTNHLGHTAFPSAAQHAHASCDRDPASPDGAISRPSESPQPDWEPYRRRPPSLLASAEGLDRQRVAPSTTHGADQYGRRASSRAEQEAATPNGVAEISPRPIPSKRFGASSEPSNQTETGSGDQRNVPPSPWVSDIRNLLAVVGAATLLINLLRAGSSRR